MVDLFNSFAHFRHFHCCRRRIRRLVKESEKSSTGRVPSTITEQRNMLRSCLRSWEGLQLIYMPGLLQYQTELGRNHIHSNPAVTESKHPEDAILLLPSSIPAHARRCISRKGLPRIEERLHTVQLDNSLETIWHILRIQSRMVTFKNKNHRGQCEGMRSRTIINCIHQKARAAGEKY